jgi:hypothetical protein
MKLETKTGELRRTALCRSKPQVVIGYRTSDNVRHQQHNEKHMTDGRDPSNEGKSPEQNGQRLESWKEIATYLARDVRTVQRWERRDGLPVHRLHHSKLGSVYAYTSELDAWRAGRDSGSARSATDETGEQAGDLAAQVREDSPAPAGATGDVGGHTVSAGKRSGAIVWAAACVMAGALAALGVVWSMRADLGTEGRPGNRAERVAPVDTSAS